MAACQGNKPMRKNQIMRFIGGLFLAALLLLSVGGAQAAPKKKKADVYFAKIKSVDTVNRVVHVDVINLNHSSKVRGPRSFVVAPDAGIGIEQMDGKMMRKMTLHNVAEASWIWISSDDGKNTRNLTASSLTSYRGTLVEMKGSTILVKLDERSRGAREERISPKEEPRSFLITGKVLYRYKGKIIDPSFVAHDAYLRITTLEKGGVVMITVLDKKK